MEHRAVFSAEKIRVCSETRKVSGPAMSRVSIGRRAPE